MRNVSGFQTANRDFGLKWNCNRSNGKQCNIGNGIQILCRIKTANPKAFLTGLLKTGIVPLRLGSESIDFLKGNTITVCWKSVIIGKSNVFCTAPVFLSVVPTFMIARANENLWLSERTAVFLTRPAIARKFAVLMHCKSRFTNRVSAWKFFLDFWYFACWEELHIHRNKHLWQCCK